MAKQSEAVHAASGVQGGAWAEDVAVAARRAEAGASAVQPSDQKGRKNGDWKMNSGTAARRTDKA